VNQRFDMSDTTSSPATTTETAAPAAAAPPGAARAKRKERVGEVISNKMAKTIIVQVARRYPHRRYKKVVTGYKKLYAHDEKSEAKVGDRVRIEETRPLSKTKRWRLVAVVEKGSGVAVVAA
jgi:small subunit ribosomal protein S17